MHIWGPKFSGYATVDWSVFSFDVDFGPGGPLWPVPISVEKFKSSFLRVDAKKEAAQTTAANAAAPPGSANATLGLQVATGSIGTIDEAIVVTAHELEITASCKVPIKSMTMGEDAKALEHLTKADLGIAPSGGFAMDASAFNVTVSHINDGDASTHFKFTPQDTLFPAALWAPEFHVDKNARPIKAVGGVSLKLAAQPKPGASRYKEAHELWDNTPSTHGAPVRTAVLPTSSLVRVILTELGDRKINVIKIVRKYAELRLKDAKDLVESSNPVLLESTPLANANKMKRDLEAEGAAVDLQFVETGTAPPEIPRRRLTFDANSQDNIHVIKLLRDTFGLDLTTARDIGNGERAYEFDGFDQDALMVFIAQVHEAGGFARIEALAPDPKPLPRDELMTLGLDPEGLADDPTQPPAPAENLELA